MTASLIDIPEWFSLLFIGISLGMGIYISTIKIKT
jgi:tellurite resistance protein TerC